MEPLGERWLVEEPFMGDEDRVEWDTVGFVAGDLPAGQFAGQSGLDQLAGQLKFGGEPDLVGNTSGGPPFGIVGP